jgi:hypothetical protein
MLSAKHEETPLARWIKCKTVGDLETLIYVDLHQVVAMIPREHSTKLLHSVGEHGELIVAETPEQLFAAKPIEFTYANRS